VPSELMNKVNVCTQWSLLSHENKLSPVICSSMTKLGERYAK
jgi:hypothetical protein